MAFLMLGEALVDLIGTLLARLQAAGWNAADPSLGAAAEAGARATESWGAVA